MSKFLTKRLIVLLVLIAMPAIALYQVATGMFTMKYDLVNQFFPCRYFISECLNNHLLPLWCPYINFGYPFHADPQGAMFYPLTTFISLAFGYNLYSVQLEYLFHLIVAGIGFYLLLRNLGISILGATVFGVCYSLSGAFISNAQHLSWIVCMAWLPYILVFFKRNLEKPSLYHTVCLAFFSSLAITGGYIGLLIIAGYFFLFYFLFTLLSFTKHENHGRLKPVLLFFTVAMLLVLLTCGGYLLSFGESIPYISRNKAVTLEQANNIPLSPHSAISFLFPFATACRSFFLDTDISMSNVYCGFLLFPFLLITLAKAKLHSFQKGLLVFGLGCLLASLGKYFVAREFLYHFFPGLNLLRHAAIFRVFGIIGLLAAIPSGFDWWRENISQKAAHLWTTKIFWGWLIVLSGILIYVFIKSGLSVHFPWLFNTGSLRLFNATASIYEHIFAEAFIQWLMLLAIIILLLLPSVSARVKYMALSFCIIMDIAIAAQMNINATVISEVRVSDLQQTLNKLPKGFPIPGRAPMEQFSEYGNAGTNPILYNFSFFSKVPAINGFNSYYLSGNEAFNNSNDRQEWIKKPLVSFSDTETSYAVKKFSPGEVVVHYRAKKNDELVLMQSMYAGWSASIDLKETEIVKKHDYFISCEVPAGEHEIHFVYTKDRIRYLYFTSLFLFAGGFFFIVYAGSKRDRPSS